jgi:hypothetical protein
MSAESFKAPQNSRQSEDDADKTRRKVIDATRQRKHRHDQRESIVLKPSIRDNQPDCIWLQGEKLYPPFNGCAKGA